MYGRPCGNVKVELRSIFTLIYAWPFIHCLHFIYACEFYVRSHGKVTRQWKSTLNNHFGKKKIVVSFSQKRIITRLKRKLRIFL